MMYDELIKNLRKMQSHEYCVLVSIDGFPAMQSVKQAADAIEELEKQLREEKVDNVNLTGWLAEEHAKAEDFENKLNLWRQGKISRWIPVTERLPEYMENVLVTDGVFSGMGWRDWYDCHGTKPREDYWIAPSTNVNELGITHWMPLPQPPESEDEEDGEEYDEHVWLSLKNAGLFVTEIASALEKIDETNASVYKKNAEEYNKKLSTLDNQYEQAVKSATTKTVLFGDRFPFRYLVDDYGISYYAAFVGCSAETEASFETIASLSAKLDELGLGCVMAIDGSDGKIARTIIRNSESQDRRVLVLDSMQSVTSADVKAGSTYLGIMEKNLGVLSEALN